MGFRHFTPEEMSRAVEAVRGGASAASAARALGCCASAVRKWCAAAGVALPSGEEPGEAAARARAADMVKRGASYYAAAKALGVDPSRVSRWCAKAGVSTSHASKAPLGPRPRRAAPADEPQRERPSDRRAMLLARLRAALPAAVAAARAERAARLEYESALDRRALP